MEINVETKASVKTFEDLNSGDTFTTKFSTTVYLVLEPDYHLGYTEEHDGYAVSLNDGEIYSFNSDMGVIPVECTLNAKEI